MGTFRKTLAGREMEGYQKASTLSYRHYTDAKDIWDIVKMLLEGSELTNKDRESQLFVNNMCCGMGQIGNNSEVTEQRMYGDCQLLISCRCLSEAHGAHANENAQNDVGNDSLNPIWLVGELEQSWNANHGQAWQIKCYLTAMDRPSTQENRVALDEERLLFLAGGQDNVVDEDVDEQPVQDLALTVDNVFQVDDCDAFNSDVDEALTTQTMFMANLSSADPVRYDEASSSYDSDILSVVPDHDKTIRLFVLNTSMKTEMHDDVQPNYVVDSHADYTSDKLYKQDQSLQTVITCCVNHSLIMMDREKDLIKMKAKALKEQTTASRPIKALTVYPPNTPATLVPRVLPTKRITERERGFKQTKECYLTKVIPFFKTLKEHFEGVQKALTKEVKEIKEFFEELEAEVDQNVVNRKYDEIERKNILIVNDNLIADCLSKDVFYIATNYELTVSRFTEMHDAHTVVQARYLELEAELSKLHDKVKKDDHTELVKLFSNLEITRAKHIEQTTALLTENENLKVQLCENMKCVTMDSIKPRVFAPGKYAIDVEPLPPRNRNNREVHLDYLKHLKESVETVREIVEEAKVERSLDSPLAFACLYTKHSQELLQYVIDTCPKDFNT
ncbi:hypothetical protein Tco_1100031 [Tanacetum coccineum]